MSMKIDWRAHVGIGTVNTARLRGQLSQALLRARRRMLKMLDEYTATWNHQPVFQGLSGYKGGDIFVGITTDDAIFWYLELGTSVRYAAMSKNFVPKTHVREIHSGPGRGGKRYVDVNQPRPGIEARDVLGEIVLTDSATLQQDLIKIVVNILIIPQG
jgi:hypothetical protein